MSLAEKITSAVMPKDEQPKMRAAAVDGVRAAEKRAGEAQASIAEQQRLASQIEARQRSAVEAGASDEEYAALDAELLQAQRRLRRVQIEAEVAARQLEEARQEQRRVENESVRKALARKCNKRLDLAKQYEDAEKERGRLWRALHQVNEEITIVYPGGQPPVGSLTDGNSLRIAFARDAYRQNANPPLYGGQPRVGVPTIPGAHCDDLRLHGLPDKLPSFVQALEEANAFLLTMLDRGI